LGDTSEDHAETRAFLDRRIDGVMRFEGIKASLRKLPGAERLAHAAFGWVRAPRPRALPGKNN
ncbi:MAG: COQ9 family protein, partial [Pararhodobacter sp.]